MQKQNNHLLIPRFFRPESTDRLTIIFHQLLHVANAGYYTHHACDAILTSLLIELTQHVLSGYILSEGSDADRRFSCMLDWVRSNAVKNITVKDIAVGFGYNRDYLSRLFRRKIQMSVVEYINYYTRVSEAKKLLYETGDSIKEIAYRVGFTDETYFMKVFKKWEQVTPTEYRNAFSQTHFSIR